MKGQSLGWIKIDNNMICRNININVLNLCWCLMCILYQLTLFNARAHEGEKGMKKFYHIYPHVQVGLQVALTPPTNRGTGLKVRPLGIIMTPM